MEAQPAAVLSASGATRFPPASPGRGPDHLAFLKTLQSYVKSPPLKTLANDLSPAPRRREETSFQTGLGHACTRTRAAWEPPHAPAAGLLSRCRELRRRRPRFRRRLRLVRVRTRAPKSDAHSHEETGNCGGLVTRRRVDLTASGVGYPGGSSATPRGRATSRSRLIRAHDGGRRTGTFVPRARGGRRHPGAESGVRGPGAATGAPARPLPWDVDAERPLCRSPRRSHEGRIARLV